MYLQWGHNAEVTLRKLSDENTTLISAYLHVIICIMQGQWGLINQAAVTKQNQEQNQEEEQEAQTRKQQLDAVCHNSDQDGGCRCYGYMLHNCMDCCD